MVPLELQWGSWESFRFAGLGLILSNDGNSEFLQSCSRSVGSFNLRWELGVPLKLQRETQCSSRVTTGDLGLLSS